MRSFSAELARGEVVRVRIASLRMRQVSTSLILALLVAAPLLQLRCAIACASEATAESADACHHQHGQTFPGIQALESRHDCGQHAIPTGILAANPGPGLDALPVASGTEALSLIRDSDMASFVITPPRGSPRSFIVPLRL